MGIIEERKRDRLAETLREEFIRYRKKMHPYFALDRSKYNDTYWEHAAEKLIEKLGYDFKVETYIKTLFDKYATATVAPPMNMLTSDKLIALFKSGLFEENDEKMCVQHLTNMEKLYASYRKFRSPAEVLVDDTIYLNALFRCVKATEEKCFHVAELYESQAISFLNENPMYRKVLGSRLPEKLKCL